MEFTERAVGRISRWTDTSWARESSRVWRADGAQGGTWYVKVHQNPRFHDREVRGLRTWAPALGAAAPRLVAADEVLRAVVITAVPGRPLHGVVLAPERERAVFRRIGALARNILYDPDTPGEAADSGPFLAVIDLDSSAASRDRPYGTWSACPTPGTGATTSSPRFSPGMAGPSPLPRRPGWPSMPRWTR
ncbi:hypothetical protein [Streptomyces sp. NPDC094031]|uniref:hypothetical protein n=1 Tax=Streptomyces sp. NPDC094031 TaxID=3155307 RepID=UPI00331EBC8B